VLDAEAVDPRPRTAPAERFEIRFPARDGDVAQDEEGCEVGLNGTARRFRFHDYADIYAVPGLYEQLFYDELECRSPTTVVALLGEELDRAGIPRERLAVLDVGAGNGMVGEELARLGAGSIVGVDIIEAAAEAAQRDRPRVYDDYHVVDLTAIPGDVRAKLEARRFNCLTSVAALGFGDIPPLAFAEAHNLVADGGWLAFTIKEDFLGEGDGTGFSRLIRRMLDEGTLELRGERRYRHRLSVTREPLHYVAMVARKRRPVPRDWAESLDD
jgi:predicted TPR repeat methyltransferase